MKKIAVIIGAGVGLGFAVAKKFATEGFNVILIARNEVSLIKMSDDLKHAGFNAGYIVADASDATSLGRAVEEVKFQHGTHDAVIYNVGITTPDSENLSADDLISHYSTDVAGAFATVHGFADEKFAEKKGAIIFTGGGLALYPADGFIPLSIDKAALRALAYILNGKYKDKGIFVGTVTVCGTINASAYLAADNISRMYWDMFCNRDKVEYTYQYPTLAPEKLYDSQPIEYGIFENNTANYWGAVYGLISEENTRK